MTSTNRFEIRKLTARIGAEVIGAGPQLDLDGDGIIEIRAALNEHKALVFRDVSVDDEGPGHRAHGRHSDGQIAEPVLASQIVDNLLSPGFTTK